MATPKILVIDGVHPKIVPLLIDQGFSVRYVDRKPSVSELSAMLPEVQGLVLRSYSLNSEESPVVIPENILAVGRAGAGTNNIPVKSLTPRGTVVFNTPGANSNSVHEEVIAAMIGSARNMFVAANWARATAKVEERYEKEKAAYRGTEVAGQTLGIVGLGNIGRRVANTALALNMNVWGYDINPKITEGLDRRITFTGDLPRLLQESDFVTLHCDYKKGEPPLIDRERVRQMRSGATLLNFARGELVDNAAVREAIENGKLSRYATDFPLSENQSYSNIEQFPHLGASTDKAEENCAIMIASQFGDFFRTGNIRNSVNYDSFGLNPSGVERVTLLTRDAPNFLSQATGTLGKRGINITGSSYQSNQHGGIPGYGYGVIDSEAHLSEEVLGEIRELPGVIRTRVLNLEEQ